MYFEEFSQERDIIFPKLSKSKPNDVMKVNMQSFHGPNMHFVTCCKMQLKSVHAVS